MSKLGFDGWVRNSRAKNRERVCGRSSTQEGGIPGTNNMKDSKAREKMESLFEN